VRRFAPLGKPHRKEGDSVIELSAIDLSCVRAGRQVFRRLCFTLRGGQLLAVTGPNGAGKSSLLRLIAGLLRPTEGRVTLAGGDPELSIGEQAHYVGHQDALKASLTVAENLAFWTRILGGTGKVEEALSGVGLGSLAPLPALHLSAGQRRRLSLARLLAIQRPIWLLDEPASNLDASSRAMLAEITHTHVAGGGLILIAVHGAIDIEASAELPLQGPSPNPQGTSPGQPP
jgi:heme exporter protein A